MVFFLTKRVSKIIFLPMLHKLEKQARSRRIELSMSDDRKRVNIKAFLEGRLLERALRLFQ